MPRIGEEHPASFADPRLRWLGFAYARTVVPFDVATTDPDRLDAWLEAVAAAGLEPHIAFTRSKAQDCRTSCAPVSTPTYTAAFKAFRDRWPAVTVITPWNEANHGSQPISARPDLAAAFYGVVREQCPECKGPALDVVDIANMDEYVRAFKNQTTALAPRIWGLHNYGDVTSATGSTTRMLGLVPGELWLTETGGIVELTRQDGTKAYTFDEVRAGRSMRRAVDIATRSSRITRTYLYQWHQRPWEAWDSALVRYDSSLRPSFDVVADWLRPGETPPPYITPPAEAEPEPVPAQEVPDDPQAPPATIAPAVRDEVLRAFEGPPPPGLTHLPLGVPRPAGRVWQLGSRLVVALRCPSGAVRGCEGSTGVRGRHPLPASLRRLVSGRFRMTAGTTATVIVKPPAGLIRRIRLRRTRRVLISLQSEGHVVWTGVVRVVRSR